jgi:hypothetical protein
VTTEQPLDQPDLHFGRGRTALLLALLIAFIVSVVWFGLAGRGDTAVSGFDKSAVRWTQEHRITKGIFHFAMLESTGISFGGSALLIAAIVAWMFLRSGRRRAALGVMAAPFIAGILVEVIFKPWFHRPINGANAFPSGSTASGAVVAVTIAMAIWKFTGRRLLTTLGFIVMLLSVVPRMYFYVLNKQHYLSDELAGIAVGLASTLLAFLAARSLRGKSGNAAIISSAGSET